MSNLTCVFRLSLHRLLLLDLALLALGQDIALVTFCIPQWIILRRWGALVVDSGRGVCLLVTRFISFLNILVRSFIRPKQYWIRRMLVIIEVIEGSWLGPRLLHILEFLSAYLRHWGQWAELIGRFAALTQSIFSFLQSSQWWDRVHVIMLHHYLFPRLFEILLSSAATELRLLEQWLFLEYMSLSSFRIYNCVVRIAQIAFVELAIMC